MLDGFCLFYIVVVDFCLTVGLIFGDLPRFRYWSVVMVSSRCLLTVQVRSCYFCLNVAGS